MPELISVYTISILLDIISGAAANYHYYYYYLYYNGSATMNVYEPQNIVHFATARQRWSHPPANYFAELDS